MKRLVILSMFFFLFSGCEKEEISPENDLQMLNATTTKLSANSKEDKMVPLKGEVIETADLSYGYLDCGIPELKEPTHYNDIGGNLTHLGSAAGGKGVLDNCRFEVRDGEQYLVADGAGYFMAANGDMLNYDGEMWISFTDPALNGSAFTITGGTGRWENAKGNFAGFFQPLEDGTLYFGVDGYVTPPGKN